MTLPRSRKRNSPRTPRSSIGWKTYLTGCCATLLVSTSFRGIHHLAVVVVVTGESGGTIPRSNNRYSYSSVDSISSRDQQHHPPWNSSPRIDDRGFLVESYRRLPGEWEEAADLRGRHGPRSRNYPNLRRIPVHVRQVPGDGNCLFHSIAACLHDAVNGTHVPMSDPGSIVQLRHRSAELRKAAVEMLQRSPRRRLFLQGDEYLEARELLQAAAAQFDLSGDEYCDLMRKESYWGGGPEIVALCNHLQRPIHIYELVASPRGGTRDRSIESDAPPSGDENNESPSLSSPNNPSPSDIGALSCPNFSLRRMACFGSPRFDRREPLHILSADSRFPDVDPRKIRKVGNHFLALFPVNRAIIARKAGDEGGNLLNNRRHASIRGGAKMKRRRRSDGGEEVTTEAMGIGELIREFVRPPWESASGVSKEDDEEGGEMDEEGSLFREFAKGCWAKIAGGF